MKKPLFFAAKGLTLVVLSLFLLNACGDSLESPEVVMQKAKEAITDVESGHVTAIADVEGQNGEDDLSFDGSMDLTFDSRDEEDKKIDLHVMLSGDMRAAEKALSGKFDLNFVTVDKQYYVKLNELSSSDESLAGMQPLIDMYKSRWLKISEEVIPQDIRDLQGEDEVTKLKQEQLKDLFRKTTLFDVVKEYGIEKYNGEKVYHYGIRPNMEGFKDYMVKAAIIDGRELTSQEVEEAVKVLTYIKDAELYIDADDYYVLKSVLTFSGAALSEGADASLEVKVVIEGSHYNESVSVKAPEGAEDFNPLNLMMGFGAMSAESGAESDEEVMLEVESPEETVAVTETEDEAAEE